MLLRLVPAFLLVASIPACSSSSDTSSSGAATAAEPIVYAASETTKSELGIATWGTSGTADSMAVSGYDSTGTVVAKVTQSIVQVDATHHYFETTYTDGAGTESAHQRVNGTVGEVDAKGNFDIELAGTDDSFATSPHAASVLSHLQADLDTGTLATTGPLEGTGNGSGGTSLINAIDVASTLGPEDDMAASGSSASGTSGDGSLVKKSCGSLVKGCGTAIVKIGAPLLPCAVLGNTARVVLTCAIAGAVVGPVGAITAGAACGLAQSLSISRSVPGCAVGAADTYKNWGSRSGDFKDQCGGAAKSGCLTPEPGTEFMMSVKL